MSLTDTFRNVASQLISDHGKAVTYRRRYSGSYDPATGLYTESTEDTSITGVIGSYSLNRVNGTTVLLGDRNLMVAAASFSVEPQPGDLVVIDGELWTAISVTGEYHGELVVLYNIQLRRA